MSIQQGHAVRRDSVEVGVAPERAPQVHHQTGRLSESIDRVESLLSTLSDKLHPIIFDCINEAKGECAPVPALAPLAEWLRAATDRVDRIEGLLHRLINTIEI